MGRDWWLVRLYGGPLDGDTPFATSLAPRLLAADLLGQPCVYVRRGREGRTAFCYDYDAAASAKLAAAAAAGA